MPAPLPPPIPASAALLPGQTLRDLLTKAEVAERLRASCATLDAWVAGGRFPAPLPRAGPRAPCRWLRQTVEDWVSQQYAASVRAARRAKE
jgi:predicted DNA-binding transcriptional regulator AlpA